MNNSGLWASEGLGQLRVENFFIFFWVGPPIVHKLQAGGPAHSLQATSCQENYFYFYVELILDLGYSGTLTKE